MVTVIYPTSNESPFTQASDLNYYVPYAKTNVNIFKKKHEDTFHYLYLLS